MRHFDGSIRLSATDLANHLGCRHLTHLDRGAAAGGLQPPRWRDPAQAVLQQRGLEHERCYVDHLRVLGLSIVPLDADENGGASAFVRAREAMRSGTDVIVQANLLSGRWHGRADILRRVDRPSELGPWSYEVVDTKLAQETRAGTILQLCLYSDIVREVQGALPEYMHVVSPGRNFAPETFRLHDYLAYYGLVKRRLETAVDTSARPPNATTYPDPVPQCDVCRWWPACDRRRRDDDHLCLVAGISKLQTRELQSRGVCTLTDLSSLPLPIAPRPRRGAPEGYGRVREQARVQLLGRTRAEPVHELLSREPGRGLACLPEPSAYDVFFDIEGDPFVGEGGLEYLLGWVVAGEKGESQYRGLWALQPGEERTAFETFVDVVLELWERWPGLHVYHYTPYDPGALKRLMGRYASREDVIDRMLRAGLFVDLHAIVKQSLRASVEKYSLKDLEVFFGFERGTPLRDAAAHKRALERTLELDRLCPVSAETLEVVEAYNRDDCVSARCLRDWLESLRAGLVEHGETIARPEPQSGDPSDAVDDRTRRTRVLAEALAAGMPARVEERSAEQRGRGLLAQLLEWHRRESKAPWWEYFRLRDLTEEDLLEEKSALAGLEFVARVGGSARCPIDRYRFPRQDTDIREENELHTTAGKKFGKVVSIVLAAGTIDIKKMGPTAEEHPRAVFEHFIPPTELLADSLFRLGEWVDQHGVDAPGPYRAARDLLLGRRPRLEGGGSELQRPGEDTMAAARRLGLALATGVLPIQGPPGAGKTHTGARMILDLVRDGRKVGVTATSHKVIRNLLDAVQKAARDEGFTVRCMQKKIKGKPSQSDPAIREVVSNEDVLAALVGGEADVAGGTAWLWAREDFFESVDVLFVDEAGQMSLANVLAVAQGARNVVLLGDPQQLEQPQKGSHPEGAQVSALEHLLAGSQTMPPDRGLFLVETWRLHPDICKFTSELFYENRLRALPGLDRQALTGATPFAGAGLWFAPVSHEGNQSSSPEEVERIAELVDSLLRDGTGWNDREGRWCALTHQDILIVAPYNSQVCDLQVRLPEARAGTVDKFQGQEAPVVIYSMTTSSPEDAPRGMEFLYSSNRLNVATSRARCACILVANPSLFEPECRTPRQMQLANAFCRYLELSRRL